MSDTILQRLLKTPQTLQEGKQIPSHPEPGEYPRAQDTIGVGKGVDPSHSGCFENPWVKAKSKWERIV